MSERQYAIKDELVRDRMATLDQIAAASGRSLEGKARDRVRRQSEEIARRIVSGESVNREHYYHR